MLERFNVVDLIEVTAAVDNHVDAKAVRHVVAKVPTPSRRVGVGVTSEVDRRNE